MEIQIVLTTDNSFFSRLARLLGAEYTHAMLRFCDLCTKHYAGEHTCHWFYLNIIEAGFRGVIERAWNPDEYSKYAAYRLAEDFEAWGDLLEYARKQIGERYAFEKLILLVPRFLHRYIVSFLVRRNLAKAKMKGDLAILFSADGQICTSLVDDCFLEVGVDLVPDIDTPWVLPDDIRDSPLLELLPPEGTVEWNDNRRR